MIKKPPENREKHIFMTAFADIQFYKFIISFTYLAGGDTIIADNLDIVNN